jgi:7-keto-8-aminopelargonate synthetase-like enzyme
MRVHTSPPAAPLIEAAAAALQQNARAGTELRKALLRRILQFRRGVAELGLVASGGLFPVQSIRLREAQAASATLRLHHALARHGVNTVLSQPGCIQGHALTFVIRADHAAQHIDHALHALAAILKPAQRVA